MKPATEIDNPASKRLLDVLRAKHLFGAPWVLDFAHLPPFDQDRLTFTMADEFQDEDKKVRRMTAQALWVLWSKANEPSQPDHEKSRVALMDRGGRSLARSGATGSFIVLSDDN